MPIATVVPAELHPTQRAYIAARALLDEAEAELARRCPPPADGSPEAAFDAWAEADEDEREALGIHALVASLVSAEDALLGWGFAVARREAGRSKRKLALIADLERGVSALRCLAYRRRAVDLALRLDPRSAT